MWLVFQWVSYTKPIYIYIYICVFQNENISKDLCIYTYLKIYIYLYIYSPIYSALNDIRLGLPPFIQNGFSAVAQTDPPFIGVTSLEILLR